MSATATTLHYLVYAADGAELIYSGTDHAAYEAARQAATAGHSGSLTGQCFQGRDRLIVTCYFRSEPAPEAVRRRREGGLLGLAWEPVDAADA
jgi:hypothetical protein